jgi:hypothetical protein
MKLAKRVQIVLPVRLHQNDQPDDVWDAACHEASINKVCPVQGK